MQGVKGLGNAIVQTSVIIPRPVPHQPRATDGMRTMKLAMLTKPLAGLLLLFLCASGTLGRASCARPTKPQVDAGAGQTEAGEADRIRRILLDDGWWQSDVQIQSWLELQRGRPDLEVKNERVWQVRVRETEALQQLMSCVALADDRERILLRVLAERYRDLAAVAGVVLLQANSTSRALEIAEVVKGWEPMFLGQILSGLHPAGRHEAWLPLARAVLVDLLMRTPRVSAADDPSSAALRALRIVAHSALAEDRTLAERAALTQPDCGWCWLLVSRVPPSDALHAVALDVRGNPNLPNDLRLASALVLRHRKAITDAQIVDELIREFQRQAADSVAIESLLPELRATRERGHARLLAILHECDPAAVSPRLPEFLSSRSDGLHAALMGQVLAISSPAAMLEATAKLSSADREVLAEALFDIGERVPSLKHRARALVPDGILKILEAESVDAQHARTSLIYFVVYWRPPH